MMKIKLSDIKDDTDGAYLDKNPDFANQLVTTLNQIDGFSSNGLTFYADSTHGTYDYRFSPHNEIDKDTFVIFNNQIRIYSLNPDNLLNLNYYQPLIGLANNNPLKDYQGTYYVQDQVLQIETGLSFDNHLNIKLTKPIDQYHQKQLSAMGKLMTNVYNLIIKDDELDGDQFEAQGEQGFSVVRDIGIVFDLNDFTNPKILLRGGDENYDENYDDQYENADLKQVLKADAPLLKFLNNNNFQADFQDYQSKANKFFKGFLD